MAISCSGSSVPSSRRLAILSGSDQTITSPLRVYLPSIFAAKTTPKLPFPTTLQLVYEMFRSLPDLPSEAVTVTILFGSSATFLVSYLPPTIPTGLTHETP